MVSVETLHDNEWLSLHVMKDEENHVGGYVYSHEKRCGGIIVAVLPFRLRSIYRGYEPEYLLREEVTPCWGMDPTRSTVTGGGDEGEEPFATAVRELLEETGYDVPAESDLWTSLGTSRASKSADTTYHLFGVDVTGLEPGEVVGDGTYYDTHAPSVWTERPWESADPQASVMWARLLPGWSTR